MKKTAVALISVFVLLIALVCVFVIGKNDSFYYSQEHVEETFMPETARKGISTYDSLVSAIKDMIISASASERLTLSDYEGDLIEDMKKATEYLTQTYPVGNYAVASIVYNPTFIASYCELQVVINYNHSYEEINSIAKVVTEEELEERIISQIRSFRTKRVFDLSDLNEYHDIREVFEKCWAQSDLYAYGLSDVSFNYYPQNDRKGLLEIEINRTGSGVEILELIEMTEKNVQTVISEYNGGGGYLDIVHFTKDHLDDNVTYDRAATGIMNDAEGSFIKRVGEYTAEGAFNDGNAAQIGMTLAASTVMKRLDLKNTVVYGALNGDPYYFIMLKNGEDRFFFDVTAGISGDGSAKYILNEKEAEKRFTWNKELYK
ncbi:MAG: hypothetical protein IJS65_00310 [Clostridia bacterium]|nr:hypothetical protein [Clostridia bacterium]